MQDNGNAMGSGYNQPSTGQAAQTQAQAATAATAIKNSESRASNYGATLAQQQTAAQQQSAQN